MDQASWESFVREPGEGSFGPVYEATKGRVWGVCRQILRDEDDALDSFQSAYARLIGMARRGELSADEADPLRLVVALAVREADSLRKRRWRRGRREIAVESASAAIDPAASPAEEAAHAELRERLLAEADALPYRLRLPLLLHYYEGLTHEEIGRGLGAPATTVSSRIAAARKRLERRMSRADWTDALGALAAAPILAGPLVEAGGTAGASALSASKIFAAASGAQAAASAPGFSLTFKLALAALAGGAAVGGYQLAQPPPPEPAVVAVVPRRVPSVPRPSPAPPPNKASLTQGGSGPARPILAYKEPKPFARSVQFFGEFRGKMLLAIGGGDDPLDVWTTDGTISGTSAFNIPFPAGTPSMRGFWILGPLGDRVILVADDLAHGKEPWVTDGTAEGTRLLADTIPGPDFSWATPLAFDRERGKLFFTAGGRAHEESTLWITDGSPEGTRAIKELNVGSASIWRMRTAFFDGRCYFEVAERGERWLCNSNGEPEGTRRLHSLGPLRGMSYLGGWPLRGLYYFPDRGKIYATDGEGSEAAPTIDLAAFVDEPEPFVDLLGWSGDIFYFCIHSGGVDAPRDLLFASDGTQSGTRLLREFPRPAGGPGIGTLSALPLGEAAYFGATDPEHGFELWRTDGAREGTRMIVDLAPGAEATGVPRSSNPFNFIPLEDGRRFIFSAMPTGIPEDGADLWISDGTEAGTRVLQDLPRGAQPRFDSRLGQPAPAIGGFLYFSSRDWDNGPAIWALKLDAIR